MNVFVLEVIRSINSTLFLETIGIYSNLESALKAIQSLPPESSKVAYNIEKFTLDAKPVDIFGDYGVKDVKELMDMGIVDQLVGEDGNFYYELTELGKQIAADLTLDDLKFNDDDEESEESDEL